MSSAFFRRPTDGSSSSSSGSDSSEEDELPTQQVTESVGEGQTIITESLSSHGSLSFGDEEDAPASSLSKVDQHRNNLLSALLEDFARNRACEIMNNARPGSQFTRLSAEVQPLAEKLYGQLSQSLSLTGILPASNDRGNQQTRAAYLAGIESLALGGVQHDLLHGPPRTRLPSLEHHLGVTSVNHQPQSLIPNLLGSPITNISLPDRTHLLPYSDLILSTPSTRRGHYESSFQQLRLLGKGGFGRVYHAYNLFDKKEYAVKKIPLSPRLSQRYRESGHKELENILREVQALAQLEHNNVVRYHATWIEEPRRMSDAVYGSRKQYLTVQGRRLIADRPRHSRPADRIAPINLQVSDGGGDGIVFGFDSQPNTPARDVESAATPTRSISETDHDQSSARASEIFTDGNTRASVLQDAGLDESVYVLHVQMSVYPMTLAQYLAPAPANARSAPSNPIRRHCFHLMPALRLLMGILCGLQYIHAKGLVHRDIKPSNIFISTLSFPTAGLVSDGYCDVGSCIGCAKPSAFYVNPRIGDFGLVAQLAREDDLETKNKSGKPSKAVGTEYYRPPMWSDSKGKAKPSTEVDEKVDVFALGVIFVELLWPCLTRTERIHVLRDLQKGRTPTGLAGKIDDEGHEPGTGEMVVQCVSGMLERDPRRRWGCQEVKHWLEMLLTRSKTLMVNHGRNGGIDGTDAVDMRKVHSLSEADGEADGGQTEESRLSRASDIGGSDSA